MVSAELERHCSKMVNLPRERLITTGRLLSQEISVRELRIESRWTVVASQLLNLQFTGSDTGNAIW